MIQPRWQNVSTVFLSWAEIIISLHFNYAICDIFKGCGHAELNCPTQFKHHCLVTWEFIISKVASLISNAPSSFITGEKVVFGDTSGLIIFLMFNLSPKHLSGWVCQWTCIIEFDWQRSSHSPFEPGHHHKDSLVASRIFKQGLATLTPNPPFFYICCWVHIFKMSHSFFRTSPKHEILNFWNTNQTTDPIQKLTVHNFIRKFCALTEGSILTLRKETQKT